MAARPWRVWLTRIVAVLVVGVLLALRHAPPTTWALPVHVGDRLARWEVVEVRRTDAEVRVSALDPIAKRRATARILDRRTPVEGPSTVTPRTRVASDGDGDGSLVDAVAARVTAWEQTAFPPPSFVGPRVTPLPLRARVETALGEAVALGWVAALLLSAGRVRRALTGWRWVELVALALLVVVPAAAVYDSGIGGVWHSNQHGFDRIVDVERDTPPAVAALGTLHGHGYYVVMQGLAALSRGSLDVFTSAQVVYALGLLALAAWAQLLWGRARAGVVAVAFAACTPIALRLSRSEDMYVPAMAWICAAGACFEAWLRTGDRRALWLAVPPAVLAAQTRAELLLFVPAWLVLSLVVRAPARVREAVRDPSAWGAVAFAALLLVPRALTLLATPPPSDLRRSSVDLAGDPRVVVLGASVLLIVAAAVWTWRGRRIAPWAAVAALPLLGGVWWLAALRDTTTQRTWQLHPLLDVGVSGWMAPGIVAAAAACLAPRAPRRTLVLLLSVVGPVWVYLAQYDALSTFVRTGLSTLPFFALLVAGLARWMTRWLALALAVTIASSFTTPVRGAHWVVARDAKAAYWDEVLAARTLPAGSTVVWLADDDIPDDARVAQLHVDRARLDEHLGPDFRVLSVRAWRAAGAPPAWFVRTPDCVRVLLSEHGDVALAGDRWTTWSYLDVSRLSTGPRVRVDDVGDDWVDPRCAALDARVGAPVWTVIPAPGNAGSIYETALGGDTRLSIAPLRAE